MLYCDRCGSLPCECHLPEPPQGVLYNSKIDQPKDMGDKPMSDKPTPCGRTFDLKYRSSTHTPSFDIDTNIIVRITSTDARMALTLVETSVVLSEKLKGMYLVSIT
jgi:hypothetical protein